MYHWKEYPSPDKLNIETPPLNVDNLPLTNGHLHTPYSFSAFSTPSQAIELAKKEGVKAVGINDFNTVKGYGDWSEACRKNGITPLFNIEMIGLNGEDQSNGVRVNDPSNPGRTYISGKGLKTENLPEKVVTWLNNAVDDNNEQSSQMTGLLNKHLEANNAPFSVDFDEIFQTLTMGQVRERHLARAVRIKTEEHFKTPEERKTFLEKIAGKEMSAMDEASVENTLRGALLKSGGPAFVPEDASSFANQETIRNLIIDAGGVPTYPFLGDALNGECSDFEKNLDNTMQKLNDRGFFSAEFITTRNSIGYLEKTAQTLWDNGFLVTLGTEHNTPALEPMVPKAKGKTGITDQVQMINVKSLCILLAHQYLTAKNGEGWLDKSTGKPRSSEKEQFIETGWKLLHYK